MARTLRTVVALAAASAAVIGLTTDAGATAPITFTTAVNSPTGSSFGPGPGAETTVVADLDGDGRPDVVVTDFATTTPRALRNLGGGHFGTAQALPASSGVLSIATADFNGDGKADI